MRYSLFDGQRDAIILLARILLMILSRPRKPLIGYSRD